MKVHQALCNRQPKPGALFCGFYRIRALSKGCKDDRNLLLRNAGTSVLNTEVLTIRIGPPGFEPDLAALWGEFDRI
jgi:hypothetical protein